MTISGIYKIVNKKNGKYYVGRSIDIHKRWAQHRTQLRKNYHWNAKLQNAWNKNGESAFDFLIVLTCPREELIQNETEFLKKAKNESTYILNFSAETPELTPEIRAKMSLAKKGKYLGSENNNFKNVPKDILEEAKNVWINGGIWKLRKWLQPQGFGYGVVVRLHKLFQSDNEAFIKRKSLSKVARQNSLARRR